MATEVDEIGEDVVMSPLKFMTLERMTWCGQLKLMRLNGMS